MSNETTTSTLDDITHASLIQPVIIQALSEKPGLNSLARIFDITDQSTKTAAVASATSYWGAPADRGAGVATAFNGTEATIPANTAVSTGGITVGAGEYLVVHRLSDNVGEDSVRAIDVIDLLKGEMLKVIGLAMDDDLLALFPSLPNNVGTTNTAMTVANMLSAYQGTRRRCADADYTVYVLDNKQVEDLEGALVAASTSVATFALAADRLINYQTSASLQSKVTGYFRGSPVVATGLTDTANAGVDAVGAFICGSSAYNDTSGATTYAAAIKRLPRFEAQRQAAARSNDLVMSARAGFGAAQSGAGASITTKAT